MVEDCYRQTMRDGGVRRTRKKQKRPAEKNTLAWPGFEPHSSGAGATRPWHPVHHFKSLLHLAYQKNKIRETLSLSSKERLTIEKAS